MTNASIENAFERLWAHIQKLLKEYLPSTGGTLTGNLSGKVITGTLLQTTEAVEKTSATRICILDDNGYMNWISSENLVGTGDGSTGNVEALLKNYATVEYVDSLMTVDTTTEV